MYINKTYSRIGELNTIILQNFDKEIFSAGTHFKDLHKFCKNNNIKDFKKYLNSLQKMSFYTSCYDKPMIVNLSGTLYNSAAVVFSNFPFTITSDENLKFKFDSIDYNSTPLGGELFLLKNLPNKIGLYIALVGGELTLKDLLQYKLLYGIADIDKNTIKELKRYTNWEPSLKSFELNPIYTNDTRLLKKKDIEWTIEEFIDRSQQENPQKVLLDLYYRKNIIEHANIQQRMKQQKSYQINNKYDRRVVNIENNHLEFERFINKHLQFQDFELENSQSTENKIKIFRIFQQQKIEDILQSLEEDGSDFAIQTYTKLKNKNKYLMQLIIDMFKIAEDKTFVECMEIEYSTQLQLFQNEQYRNSAFIKDQDLNLLTKIKVKEQDETFILKKHRKDLLPTRKYYKEFPEAFLCYLNQTDLQNPYQCDNYMNIVKGNLFRIGVDYLNPTYDREEVKTKLGLFFSQQENLDKKFQEFHDFISDKKMLQDHLNQRQQAINNILKEEDFQQFLNTIIDQIQEQNFNDKQQLIQKRVKELIRLQQGKEMNKIKNFFVKTFFTKPNTNSLADDIIFGDQKLLDIGSDRYSLSKRYQKKIDFKEIKKKYSANHSVNEKDLQNYLNNKDITVQSKLNNNKNMKVKINWSKQYVKRDNYLVRKRKWKTNMQLADYIHQRGLPQAEINYRKNMVEFLKQSFERSCRVLNQDEQQEFEKIVLDTFFIDYKQYQDLRDLMNHAMNNLLQFHKPIIGEQDVKLKDFENRQQDEQIKIDFNQQKIEELKNLIFMEKKENLQNHNFLITCDTLQQFLTQSDFLSEQEKQQFEILFNSDNKFIKEFQNNCQKEFNQTMDDLQKTKHNFIEDFNNQLNFIQVNYDLELRNYILPNIFYRNAKIFLKQVQQLYDEIQKSNGLEDQQQMKKIFIENKIFKDNIINVKELDEQIKLMVSILNQTKNMLTDQDLILDRQYDIIQESLKNIVGESNQVQKMVKFLHDKVLQISSEEDNPIYSTDELEQILTTKQDLKRFLEKHQIERRKNWNPIFNDIANLYQDMVNNIDVIYDRQNGLKDLQNSYKESVDSISDKLIASGIIIDYHPFQNLLSIHDKIQNKLMIQELQDNQDIEFYDQFFYLEKQNIDQSNTRFFNTTPPTILQMEKLSKRLAHRGSSAMDLYLKNTKVPFLQLIDETGEEWVMDQLQSILKDIFKIRYKIESKMTQDQLINLDLQISSIMNKDYIKQALQHSFNDYKFQLEQIRQKVQDFYHLDKSYKQEQKDKVQRFKDFDPIKDIDYLKLALSFVLASLNCNDFQDFNFEEIKNDFGDIIKNPKRFMRKRKEWNIKPAALTEEKSELDLPKQNLVHFDHSNLYSHAARVMYNKYQNTIFKRTDQKTDEVLVTLNKKANVFLTE